MKVRVVRVDSARSPAWADAAVDGWRKRLGRGLPTDEQVVPIEPFRGDVEAVRSAESERVLKVVGRGRLVALDERGDGVDTAGFVQLIAAGRAAGDLVFALGGPYGHAPALRDAAWRVVKLSDLVLAHDVARVVLWEQIYRAHAIASGSPYHHS